VGTYTVPANTVSTLIGLTIANITNNAIDCSVAHVDSSNNQTRIVSAVPVPVGSTLVIVGGAQKVVLETGDFISVTASANTSTDVVMSLLEIEE
jgi:hypothetical protein